VTVTVNPIPATPTITPAGPTTFCAGGSVTLTSSSATGNQWLLNGNPIGGATANTYSATAGGSYTVVVTSNGCSSAASAAVAVTVNPIPATPTITPAGPANICAGQTAGLSSSSATGNQWMLNGAPIGGATGQLYTASAAGDYSVVVTANGCSSAASAVVTVSITTVNATITAPGSVVAGSTGNTASVADAGAGATYQWSITGGSITAGGTARTVTFTAGGAGTLTLQATVQVSACSDTKPANVTVTAAPSTVTVTGVTPSAGKSTGGKSVTVSGTGFQSGATVTFGGAAATNVVVVNATTITAKTPAHAPGPVSVTVTNPDTSSGTRTNAYTFVTTQFDPNGDTRIDPSDIFYLVNYLFLSGPAPAGPAGMLSGDANGDGNVDPSDIFYIVNYLFLGGPLPASEPAHLAPRATTGILAGSVSLGEPMRRGSRWIVPVMIGAPDGAEVPQALSLRVMFSGDEVRGAAIRHAAGLTPSFEISRRSANALSYLVMFDRGLHGVVGEIELETGAGAHVAIDVDPALTLLSDSGGTRSATVAAGTLQVKGTTIEAPEQRAPRKGLK
jgi:hypothetical protein